MKELEQEVPARRLTQVLGGFGLTDEQIRQTLACFPPTSAPDPCRWVELNDSFSLNDGRVWLYPLTLHEVYSPGYLRWMNDLEVTTKIGRFDNLRPVTRRELVDYYFSLDPASTIFLAIYLDEGGLGQGKKEALRFVGTLKLYGIDRLARLAGIGIMVGERDCWDKGIGSAAIDLACGYLFQTLGLQKVEAGYLLPNAGMARAFEKCGFTVEGTLRRHFYLKGEVVDHVLVARFAKSP